jgi:hypothetical protein
MKAYKVLSIDAWGNSDEGFEWNNWFNAGNVTLDIDANKQAILEAMHNAGFISNVAGGDVDDDGYNLVIVDKATTEPLFAIEYGSTI